MSYTFVDMFKGLVFLTLVLFSVILLKTLLDILLFDEILKLHIYLKESLFYLGLIRFRHLYIQNVFGKLYLFFDCVTKFITTADCDTVVDPMVFEVHLEYRNFLEGSYVSKWCLYCIKLAKRFQIIYYLFILLKYIFKWLYQHMHFSGIPPFIPYALFFILFMHEFINNEFMLIYKALVLLIPITIYIQLLTFYSTKDDVDTGNLHRYFYKNELDYKKQRDFLLNKDIYYLPEIMKSSQAQVLISPLGYEKFVIYITNNLMQDEKAYVKVQKNAKWMYFRYILTMISTIGVGYILYIKDTYKLVILNYDLPLSIVFIVLVPLIIMIYVSQKVFKLRSDATWPSWSQYVYNSKYNTIFWIFTLFQLYVFWVLLVKGNINFVYDDCLWKGFGIEISKLYSIEEKITFFKSHYEFSIKMLQTDNIAVQHLDNLNLFISQLNLNDLIGVETTILDLTGFINSLFVNYAYQWELYQKQLMELSTQYNDPLLHIRPYMYFIKNTINIISIWSFFIHFLDAFYIINDPMNPRFIKLLYAFCKLWR